MARYYARRSALSWLADGTPCSARRAAFRARTDSRRLDGPKANPRDVAVAALEDIEAGAYEVSAVDTTRWVKSNCPSTRRPDVQMTQRRIRLAGAVRLEQSTGLTTRAGLAGPRRRERPGG